MSSCEQEVTSIRKKLEEITAGGNDAQVSSIYPRWINLNVTIEK